MLFHIYRTPEDMKSDDNYITVPLYLFYTIPELKDTVIITVPQEGYTVSSKVARLNPRKTFARLFIDTWTYSVIYDEED